MNLEMRFSHLDVSKNGGVYTPKMDGEDFMENPIF